MDQLDPVTMRYYRVYRYRWYIINHEDCAKHPITECQFWPDIEEMQQDGTLVKMWPVRPLLLNEFLKKRRGYVWYQDYVSLAEHSLVGTFQFGTTGRKKLKYPNMINKKQWKELEK